MKRPSKFLLHVILTILIFSPRALAKEEKATEPSVSADFGLLEKMMNEDRNFAVEALRMGGQYQLNHGNPAAAAALYKEAMRLSSEPAVMENYAQALVATGKTKEAVVLWDKILAGRGDDVGTRMRYAYFLDKAGEADSAISQMRGLVKQQPDNAAFRYWIVDAYVRAGRNKDAQNELQSMMRDFPKEKNEVQRRLGLLSPVTVKASAPAAAVKEMITPAPAKEEASAPEESEQPAEGEEAPAPKKNQWF